MYTKNNSVHITIHEVQVSKTVMVLELADFFLTKVHHPEVCETVV